MFCVILCYTEICLHFTGSSNASSFYGGAARPHPPSHRGAPTLSSPRRGRGVGRSRGRGRGVGRARVRGGRARGDGARGRASGRGQVARGPAVQLHEGYADDDLGNQPLPFRPAHPVGVHLGQRLVRGAFTRAVEFFNLFFTVELINNIVSHTNSYAYEHIETHQSYAKRDGSWLECTADEIRRLIAILIYFGLVRVSDVVDNYWSRKSLYHGLWGKCFMPLIRFKGLMAMLHVVDPACETEGDKLRKVNTLVEFFKVRCKELYQPRRNVAVDERMVKSRHRSGIRQFNKDKPIRWGIKLWVLADSSNGYTIDFNVYIGKVAGQEISANGLGYDVVMKLISPYLNQGYHLYVDNFYTSVTLFKDLFTRGVGATGTIRENRRDFPENLKDSKVWAKGKNRGSIRWGRDPPCLALQWLDNKVVSMLTTIDNANVKMQATRKVKSAHGGWSSTVVPQPAVIGNYNQYMNAVDRSDQILGTNNVHRKSCRWWKTVFYHLIDIAIVNGFILFQEHRRKFPDEPALRRPAAYSLVHFREEVVRGLCDFPEKGSPVTQAASQPAPSPSFVTEHIPAFGEERKHCVVCWQKEKKQLRVQSYCKAPQCNRYMHISSDKNCFEIYHSPDYPYKR